MMTSFAVTKHDDGAGVARLVIVGELDEDTSAGLAGLIGNAVRQGGVTEVVVDLRGVTALAAAGVRALVRGRAAAAAMNRGFRVVNADDTALRVLTVSGVLEVLAVAAADNAASEGLHTVRPGATGTVTEHPSRSAAWRSLPGLPGRH
jgi:anti-anti-sigma factor